MYLSRFCIESKCASFVRVPLLCSITNDELTNRLFIDFPTSCCFLRRIFRQSRPYTSPREFFFLSMLVDRRVKLNFFEISFVSIGGFILKNVENINIVRCGNRRRKIYRFELIFKVYCRLIINFYVSLIICTEITFVTFKIP